jgi:hypothetical protein
MTGRVSLGVIEARDAELILGARRLSAGWRADRLPAPGYFLVLVPSAYEQPRPARAFWLTKEAVRAAVGRLGQERPALDATRATRPPARRSCLNSRRRQRRTLACRPPQMRTGR